MGPVRGSYGSRKSLPWIGAIATFGSHVSQFQDGWHRQRNSKRSLHIILSVAKDRWGRGKAQASTDPPEANSLRAGRFALQLILRCAQDDVRAGFSDALC